MRKNDRRFGVRENRRDLGSDRTREGIGLESERIPKRNYKEQEEFGYDICFLGLNWGRR